MAAMLRMVKLDVKTLKDAYKGKSADEAEPDEPERERPKSRKRSKGDDA
jgi:hypothetical protein